jgi:hypothetical protein
MRPNVWYGFLWVLPIAASQHEQFQTRQICTVPTAGTNLTDDAPAFIEAFRECGNGGTVLFKNTTYYVNSVMNTSGLQDCIVDLQGTLMVSVPFTCSVLVRANKQSSQWSTYIDYWLNNSITVGYQNQSTAFKLGGDRVLLDGHGYGTFDGNGAVLVSLRQWDIQSQGKTSCSYSGWIVQLKSNGCEILAKPDVVSCRLPRHGLSTSLADRIPGQCQLSTAASLSLRTSLSTTPDWTGHQAVSFCRPSATRASRAHLLHRQHRRCRYILLLAHCLSQYHGGQQGRQHLLQGELDRHHNQGLYVHQRARNRDRQHRPVQG